MTTKTIIFSIVLLQCLVSSIRGEPSYYRQYRILSGNYPDVYYPNDYSYYTNPYRYTYTRPSYTHDYEDNKLYITDKYGRTTVTSKAALAAASPCARDPCGQNAQCTESSGRPVCSCLTGYSGDPLTYCRRQECINNNECRSDQTCRSGKCVNPCGDACGYRANCNVRNHIPTCSCPTSFKGDPLVSCVRADPEDLCRPSPCGPNTSCRVVNNSPTCTCLPGFFGSPLSGCRRECESDSECSSNKACIDFKCQNPCNTQCGKNAECETIRNHQAVCKCPKNYFGNPYSSCQPECYGDVDCPSGRPACIYGICKNPCDGACGVGANCELRGLTPICSCPRDMTGDPFVSCRPFTPQDLCEPNPCGANARCEPGFDRYNKERPVCTCHSGYIGNPLTGCIRAECIENEECAGSQACVNNSCQNPCIGQCGVNANCTPSRHRAICSCPPGYYGDALVQCTRRPVQ